MKVSVGLECSGWSNTVRPLDSRVYSEMSPTVLTKVKPSTVAAGSAARQMKTQEMARSRKEKRRVMREGGSGVRTLTPRSPSAKSIAVVDASSLVRTKARPVTSKAHDNRE